MVFGWRFTRTKSIILPELACVKCKTVGKLEIEVFQQYLHLLWIPFFPSGKYASSTCRRCGDNHTNAEVPAEYQEAATQAKAQASTPIWVFAGLPIVLLAFWLAAKDLLFRGSSVSAAKGAVSVEQCLSTLHDNQLFELNLGVPSYQKKAVKTLIKLSKVDRSTLVYLKGLMQRNLETPMLDDASMQHFGPQEIRVSREEFSKLPLLDCR